MQELFEDITIAKNIIIFLLKSLISEDSLKTYNFKARKTSASYFLSIT